jgi:hypothetical protein
MGKFLAPKITTTDRTALTLDDGEIVYDTDLQEFYYGDGTTAGGILMGGTSAWGSITGTLSSQTDLDTALNSKVDENTAITGATKTKITYDAKGLVTAGADATTADISDSSNKRYVTDAQLTVIGNTSGTNSGNETTSTIGTLINGSSTATPNDADLVATAESSVLKKITWTNVKSFLKTYFDTVYQAAGSYLTSANISDTAYGAGWNGDTTNAPSKNAVYDEMETKQDSLGFTPENVSNKETTALDTSTTKYPCNNVVKVAVDGKLNTPTGTPDGTKYLRDDNTWQPIHAAGLTQEQVEGLI